MGIRLLLLVGFAITTVVYGYPPQFQDERPVLADGRKLNSKGTVHVYNNEEHKPNKNPVHDVLEGKHVYAVEEANEEKERLYDTAKQTTLTPELYKQPYHKYQPEEIKHQHSPEYSKISSAHNDNKNRGPQTFTPVTEESSYKYYKKPDGETEIYYDRPTHTQIPHQNFDLVPPQPKTSVHDISSVTKEPSLFYPTQSPQNHRSESDISQTAEPSYSSLSSKDYTFDAVHKEGYIYSQLPSQNIPHSDSTTLFPNQPQIIHDRSSKVEHISEVLHSTSTHTAPQAPHDVVYTSRPTYPVTPPISSDASNVQYSNIKYPNTTPHYTHHSNFDTAHQIQSPNTNSEKSPSILHPGKICPPTEYSRIPSHNAHSVTETDSSPYNHPTTQVSFQTEYGSHSISPSYHHSSNSHESTQSHEISSQNIPTTISHSNYQPSIEHKQHYSNPSHVSHPSLETERPVKVEHQTESAHYYLASVHPQLNSASMTTNTKEETQSVSTHPPQYQIHNAKHSISQIKNQDEYSRTGDTNHHSTSQISYKESQQIPPYASIHKVSPTYTQNKPNVDYHDSKVVYQNEPPQTSPTHHLTNSNSHLKYSTEATSISLSLSTTPSYPSLHIEPPYSDSYPGSHEEHKTVYPLHNKHTHISDLEYPLKSSSYSTSTEAIHVSPQSSFNVHNHKITPLGKHSDNIPTHIEAVSKAAFPSFHEEPPHQDSYPYSNTQHQTIPISKQPTQSTHPYRTHKQDQTESAYPALPRKVSSYPLSSYSTTHSAPYTKSHAEPHKEHSNPSFSTNPQTSPYPKSLVEHQKEPSKPLSSYGTTPHHTPYPEAHIKHHEELSYPPSSHSTSSQSAQYPEVHIREPSYPSSSYKTTHHSAPNTKSHAEHFKHSFSTVPQRFPYPESHVKNHKEPSKPLSSYSTIPHHASYPGTHIKHHEEPPYPSHSTTPHSAQYSEAHVKESSYPSSSYSITPHSAPYPEDHVKELFYPSHSTTPHSTQYSEAHIKEPSYPSYSTTPHSAPYPEPHVKELFYPPDSTTQHSEAYIKEPSNPSSSYSTTPHNAQYPEAHVKYHKEPSYFSYSTTPHNPVYSNAQAEHNIESSNLSSSHSTNHGVHLEHTKDYVHTLSSHSTDNPSVHIEHRVKSLYPLHSNTPTSTAYPSSHKELSLHSRSYSPTTRSEAHIEHQGKSYPDSQHTKHKTKSLSHNMPLLEHHTKSQFFLIQHN